MIDDAMSGDDAAFVLMDEMRRRRRCWCCDAFYWMSNCTMRLGIDSNCPDARVGSTVGGAVAVDSMRQNCSTMHRLSMVHDFCLNCSESL